MSSREREEKVKRSNKKIRDLEYVEKLKPTLRAMLINRRNQLIKKYEEEVRFLDKLLAKPTLEE